MKDDQGHHDQSSMTVNGNQRKYDIKLPSTKTRTGSSSVRITLANHAGAHQTARRRTGGPLPFYILQPPSNNADFWHLTATEECIRRHVIKELDNRLDMEQPTRFPSDRPQYSSDGVIAVLVRGELCDEIRQCFRVGESVKSISE